MKRIISLIGVVFVLTVAGFGAYVWHWEHRPHVLEIYCFALDKSGNSPGDLAVFIRTPDGHTILIDGGKSSSIAATLASVMPFYRRTIDTLISTNPDDSHITGLADLAVRYHIGQVIEMDASVPEFAATSSAHIAFENAISAQKIRHIEVSAGDGIDFGDPDISATVLFPPLLLLSSPPTPTTSTENPSNSAGSTPFAFSKTNFPVLAFLIRYESTTVLFGGDISKKEQAYLAAQDSSSQSSFPDLSHQNILLILPHGENAGAADEDFFTIFNPQDVLVLKKIGVPAKPKQKPASTPAPKTKKAPKKSAKPPFDISAIPDMTIMNLTSGGNVEFISDGNSFVEKKIN